jgi:hypothetical protein
MFKQSAKQDPPILMKSIKKYPGEHHLLTGILFQTKQGLCLSVAPLQRTN